MKLIPHQRMESIRRRLVRLYGDEAPKLIERLYMMIGRYGVGIDVIPETDYWNENDVVLITYADMVKRPGERPLATLKRFLDERLHGVVKTVHILPFTSWSSDDGFSVTDYRKVSPLYGRWEEVEALGGQFQLMFDLVLNHCSAQSPWFRDYLKGIQPASDYFIEADPNKDLSQVVRPRPWPLLTKFTTNEGDAHVWTTFSDDQVDLDWSNPNVLFEFIDILLLYISKGMRIVRMDAVAFVWKEIGTTCMHLPQTHEIVKLFRDIVSIVAPQVLILTETNVPHEENISYFGRGDEAHMVYQFSLPPLLLYALLRGDCGYLREWAASLPEPEAGTTYFNFTASHDGIGVRPLHGLLPENELAWLIDQIRSRGGHVSTRRLEDGSESPYELNITYSSALTDADNEALGRQRFLCSQAVALSMRGVPAVYFHSLMATPNDLAGVEDLGYPRAINRKRWDDAELTNKLEDADSPYAKVFATLTALIRRRAGHPSFHPDAPQTILDFGKAVFALRRDSCDGGQSILCLFNFTASPQSVPYEAIDRVFDETESLKLRDVVSGLHVDRGDKKHFELAPYQAAWLVAG